MALGFPDRLPPSIRALRDRCRRLAWVTLAARLVAVGLLADLASVSQSVTTVCIKNALGLLPPLVLMGAERLERRSPDDRYPYGLYSGITVGYLMASLALLAMGLFLLLASLRSLLSGTRPDVGDLAIAGMHIWLGWAMIAALGYAGLTPVVLGRLKRPLAIELHDPVLFADSETGRANTLSAVMAILGIAGIGYGLWWADYAAATAAAVVIVWEGTRNVAAALHDVVDGTPRRLASRAPDRLHDDLRRLVRNEPWVRHVRVRLRSEGRLLTGEIFLWVHPQTSDPLGRMQSLRERAHRLDWRLYDLALVPVSDEPPDAGGDIRGQ